MVMLVSLDEVRTHCRVTTGVEDDDLIEKIEAASEAVLSYLKTYDFVDSTGEVVEALLPRAVSQATFKLVESFYSDRGGAGEGWDRPNYLPTTVVALLYPLRDPAAC